MTVIPPTRAAYDPTLGDRVHAELTADLEAGVTEVHKALATGAPPELVGLRVQDLHARLREGRPSLTVDEALGLVVGMLVTTDEVQA